MADGLTITALIIAILALLLGAAFIIIHFVVPSPTNTGGIGPTGPAGLSGSTGYTGYTGDIGPTGPVGVTEFDGISVTLGNDVNYITPNSIGNWTDTYDSSYYTTNDFDLITGDYTVPQDGNFLISFKYSTDTAIAPFIYKNDVLLLTSDVAETQGQISGVFYLEKNDLIYIALNDNCTINAFFNNIPITTLNISLLEGIIGSTGDVGPTGNTGPKGDKGDKGDVGPQGDVGPAGSKGDPGPAGSSFNNYATFYTYNGFTGTIDDTGLVRYINFDNVITSSQNWQQIPTDNFVFNTTGVYLLTYSTRIIPNSDKMNYILNIFRDGGNIAGSEVLALTTDQQSQSVMSSFLSGSCIVSINAGSSIRLKLYVYGNTPNVPHIYGVPTYSYLNAAQATSMLTITRIN
jgi:hypothetical protein